MEIKTISEPGCYMFTFAVNLDIYGSQLLEAAGETAMFTPGMMNMFIVNSS